MHEASLTRHLPPPEVVNAQKASGTLAGLCELPTEAQEQNYREVDEQLQQAQLLLEESLPADYHGKRQLCSRATPPHTQALEEQTKREKEFLRVQASQAKEADGSTDLEHKFLRFAVVF